MSQNYRDQTLKDTSRKLRAISDCCQKVQADLCLSKLALSLSSNLVLDFVS